MIDREMKNRMWDADVGDYILSQDDGISEEIVTQHMSLREAIKRIISRDTMLVDIDESEAFRDVLDVLQLTGGEYEGSSRWHISVPEGMSADAWFRIDN